MQHDKGIFSMTKKNSCYNYTDVNYTTGTFCILAIGILLCLHLCHWRIRMKGETLRRTLYGSFTECKRKIFFIHA